MSTKSPALSSPNVSTLASLRNIPAAHGPRNTPTQSSHLKMASLFVIALLTHLKRPLA